MSSNVKKYNNDWLCVSCGHILGNVVGGEFRPSVPSTYLRTSGPNLVVTCPECMVTKVWYTADPVVKAIYQLVDAISNVAARAMVNEVGKALHTKSDE